jgi:hypothetical protein
MVKCFSCKKEVDKKNVFKLTFTPHNKFSHVIFFCKKKECKKFFKQLRIKEAFDL